MVPGEQLGVWCLAQGSHLSRGIESGESAGYSLSLTHRQFLPDLRLDPATFPAKSTFLSIRPRLMKHNLCMKTVQNNSKQICQWIWMWEDNGGWTFFCYREINMLYLNIKTYLYSIQFIQIDRLFALRDFNWWTGLLKYYCDLFISCLDSHPDSTHSLIFTWELHFENSSSFWTWRGLQDTYCLYESNDKVLLTSCEPCQYQQVSLGLKCSMLNFVHYFNSAVLW